MLQENIFASIKLGFLTLDKRQILLINFNFAGWNK